MKFVKRILFVATGILIFTLAHAQPGMLLTELARMSGVEIREMQCDDFFSEKYEFTITQPLDHQNSEKGTFQQVFILSHLDFNNPVVFVTEGYAAGHAEDPRYVNELSYYLKANQVVAEHRYFARSTPDTIDWQYLTIENAATDHHRIVEFLKTLYQGKWINTGISKGGQTAMYHRYFYPDDVDATVGYVCPLNFSTEDLRVYEFLDRVGDSACRQKIHDFQKMMFERKAACLPVFEKMAKKQHLHYKMGLEAGYELLVLEYSFAFWQWGNFSCEEIPGYQAKPKDLVRYLDEVAGIDWISDEGVHDLQPFFYQALTEIGMYGYDLTEFDGLITALTDNTFSFTCPEGVDCIYDPVPMQKIDHFVRHEAHNMMFIYGEWDAWSSTAVQWSGNPGVVLVINPEGSHLTRIRNLPEEQKQKVFSTLEDWLGLIMNQKNK